MANGLGGVTYELVLSPVESEIPERRCPLQPGVAFKVGRKEDNDFVIPVKGVSSQHLEISLPEPPEDSEHGPVVWVKDVSTNGTGVQEPGSESLIRVSKEAATTKLPHGGKIVVPFKVKSMEARTKLDVQVIKVVPPEPPKEPTKSSSSSSASPEKKKVEVKKDSKSKKKDSKSKRKKSSSSSSKSSSSKSKKKKKKRGKSQSRGKKKTLTKPVQIKRSQA